MLLTKLNLMLKIMILMKKTELYGKIRDRFYVLIKDYVKIR